MHKLLHEVLLSCPPLSCATHTFTVLDNQMLAVIGKKDMLPCKNYAAYFDRFFFAAGKLLSSVLNCRCYNYLRTVSLDRCVVYPIDTALL